MAERLAAIFAVAALIPLTACKPSPALAPTVPSDSPRVVSDDGQTQITTVCDSGLYRLYIARTAQGVSITSERDASCDE